MTARHKVAQEGAAMSAYTIRVQGHLGPHWSAWFDGMSLSNEANGETVISGPVKDQAELHSLLVKIYNLNLTLISVLRIETDATA
jgi:hypothetical protein